MLILKQNSGTKDCVPAVAAMITDTSIAEFKKEFPTADEGYSDYEFCKYLFDRGFICGFHVDLSQFPEKVTAETKVKVEFRLKECSAYVVVKSDCGLNEHAILWYNGKVYDPNPMKKNEVSLSEYEILRFYPIINMKE